VIIPQIDWRTVLHSQAPVGNGPLQDMFRIARKTSGTPLFIQPLKPPRILSSYSINELPELSREKLLSSPQNFDVIFFGLIPTERGRTTGCQTPVSLDRRGLQGGLQTLLPSGPCMFCMHGEKVEADSYHYFTYVKCYPVTLLTKVVLHSSNIVRNFWTQGMHVKSRMSNRPPPLPQIDYYTTESNNSVLL
jgi:hypothetical protein